MIPKLLHPVSVIVEKRMKAQNTASQFDDDFREEIADAKYGAPFTMRCQVEYRKGIDVRPGSLMQEQQTGGPDFQDEGYLLFRHRDLDAAGWNPEPGDRFTRIDDREVDLYVASLSLQGHSSGKSQLRKCYFTDRAPT